MPPVPGSLRRRPCMRAHCWRCCRQPLQCCSARCLTLLCLAMLGKRERKCAAQCFLHLRHCLALCPHAQALATRHQCRPGQALQRACLHGGSGKCRAAAAGAGTPASPATGGAPIGRRSARSRHARCRCSSACCRPGVLPPANGRLPRASRPRAPRERARESRALPRALRALHPCWVACPAHCPGCPATAGSRGPRCRNARNRHAHCRHSPSRWVGLPPLPCARCALPFLPALPSLPFSELNHQKFAQLGEQRALPAFQAWPKRPA